MKWEYNCFAFFFRPRENRGAGENWKLFEHRREREKNNYIISHLNELGKDGWELCGNLLIKPTPDGLCFSGHFKREIPEPPKYNPAELHSEVDDGRAHSDAHHSTLILSKGETL
jgi:hypothetical protein